MSDNKFGVESRWGGSESQPSKQRMEELIAELLVRDEEHPDTWLTHEPTGWIIRLDENRVAYLEDPDLKTVSHMREISPQHALKLWSLFSAGGHEAVLTEPWVEGPPPVSAEEIQARKERAGELTLAMDLQFYDQLGPERQEVYCKTEGCSRGAIQYSIYCRSHHFESLRRRSCPFSH